MLNFVLEWSYINNYLNSEPVSLLVQEFIELVDKYTKTQHLQKFIDNCLEADHQDVLRQIKDKQGSRVYEKMVSCCDETRLERLINVHFRQELKTLCLHPFANFVVQRLFERCPSEEIFTDLDDEISSSLDEIWNRKKFGVIVAIANASAKTNSQQTNVKKEIFDRLQCSNNNSKKLLVPALFMIKSANQLETDSSGNAEIVYNKIQQGTMLVQAMLKMKKVDEIADSLLSMRPETLIELVRNGASSRVIEVFFQCTNITSEQKCNLFSKIKSEIHKVAVDRFGSRVLELFWNSDFVTTKLRSQIASVLIKKESIMCKDFIGKIIWSKFDLNLYNKDQHRWMLKHGK